MRKTLATCAFITFTLCGGGAAFAAEPSLHEVYQAADSGHVEQAQRMMQNVLQAHPDSAKAHYVEAELLARQGLLAQARSELATARRLAPGLPFASEHSVSELERTLRTGGNATPASNHPSSYVPPATVTASDSGFPWGWLIGGIGLLAAFAFFLRGLNQRQNPSGYGPAGYPGNPGPTLYRGPQPQPAAPGGGSVAYPPAPGYGYPPAAPAPAAGGLGSQMLGGLATGAAVGAGVAAGEALMHRWLDDRPHGSGNETVVLPAQDTVYVSDNRNSAGGYDYDFGVNDAGSWDDSSSSGDSSDWV